MAVLCWRFQMALVILVLHSFGYESLDDIAFVLFRPCNISILTTSMPFFKVLRYATQQNSLSRSMMCPSGSFTFGSDPSWYR